MTLFNPSAVSSVTANDPLPKGLVINNHGILGGYVDNIDSDREDYHVSLTVTDLSGNSEEVDLQIVFVPASPALQAADVNAIVPYELNAACTPATVCGQNSDCYSKVCPFPEAGCYCGGKSTCICAL